MKEEEEDEDEDEEKKTEEWETEAEKKNIDYSLTNIYTQSTSKAIITRPKDILSK